MLKTRNLHCLTRVHPSSSLSVSAAPKGNLTSIGPNPLKLPEGSAQPLHYDILGVKVGAPLRTVKLKYLVACRKYHPECGGDPEMFLRASLAYQDVLKDYGIESVRGEVLNLGNFQADPYLARQYLEARSKITEYIPMSTLDEHIAQLEEAQSKISFDLEKRITANDTDAMWLLEDIDSVTEKTGSDTVTLRLSDTGAVTAHEDKHLLEGETVAKGLLGVSNSPDPKPTQGESEEADANNHDNRNTASAQSSGETDEPKQAENTSIVETVTLNKHDIQALNAKHMVQQRDDIAGLASRTATTVMNNTLETREFRDTLVTLGFLVIALGVLLYVALEAWGRAAMMEKHSPQSAGQLSSETMLPWWGNDIAYEKQVKRIFVEEWRKARSSARKSQIFQEGISRESLPVAEREHLDLSIFSVTSDKLREMREQVGSQSGKQ